MATDINPFRPAEQVAPKIKAFVFGASGVGKTYFALTAPGTIAAIDTEGGMAFYAKRAGKGSLSAFEVLPTKTFRDVLAGVRYVKEHPTAYGTLVIDPITVIYETLQDAAQIRRANQRNDQDADLEMLDWQRIKRAYKALMTELVNLPVHVIVVARERDETEKRGKENIKIGVKPDAEKGTAYFFDTVVHLVPSEGGREAVILKDRTGVHALNVRIENPTFDSLFGAAIKAGRKDTGERGVQDDVEAAQIDAAVEQRNAPETRAADPDGLIGTVEVGTSNDSDFELRQTPDGYRLGFRLVSDRGKIKAYAMGILAEELKTYQEQIVGQRVTCWGRISEESWTPKGATRPVTYQVLAVSRMSVPGLGVLPLPVEAATVPLFDDAEEAAIDAALEAVK